LSLHDAITPFIPGLRRYAHALLVDTPASSRCADELLQRTLSRALKDERLKRGGSLRPWLYTTLTLLNRSRLRALDAARSERTGTNAGAAASRSASAEPVSQSKIERGLSALEPELREVLLLVVLERMSYEEVAEIVEVPLATMFSRLTRARDELRHLYNGTARHETAPRRQTAARVPGHLRLVK
jgi:RNA polymerase sigma factor (sigma-70 family)